MLKRLFLWTTIFLALILSCNKFITCAEDSFVELNATATASSSLQPAGNAVDGNLNSRWESVHNSDNEWLLVDLGEYKSINEVRISWETAAAKVYDIQVSLDNKSFTTVYSVTNGKDLEVRDVVFAPVDAKYVRVICKERTTVYGYSIFEISIYGRDPEGIYIPEGVENSSVADVFDDKRSRDFAITSLASKKVYACGDIDIKWSKPTNLDNKTVDKYEIYINGEKIAETKDNIYTYYTTKVAYETVWIKAIYSDGSTNSCLPVKFGTTKKGLGLSTDMGANLNLEDMKVGWYYNWSEYKSSGSQYNNVEFVPMIWKETNKNNATSRLNSLVKQKYKYCLTFNEPDLGNQCNMSVDEVYDVYGGLMNDSIKVSSPVTALWPSASDGWFQPFMNKVNSNENIDVDFIAIHSYPGNFAGADMAKWFVDTVVGDAWKLYHKPIWITEFSTEGYLVTSEGTKEFWEAVMPLLDDCEYVVRYSAFGFDSDTVGLWRYSSGNLTDAGKAYKNNGNPVDDGRVYEQPKDIIVEKEFASIEKYSVELDGYITLNAYISMSDSLLNSKDIVVNMKAKDISVSYNCESLEKVGGLIKCKLPLPAAYMCENITIEIKKNEQLLTSGSTSVREYAEYILNSNDSEYASAKPLISAMLNYGAYAQEYFEYNLNNMSNLALFADANNPVSMTYDELLNYKYNTIENNSLDNLQYFGGSLVCESGTSIKLYFDVSDSKLTLDDFERNYIVKITDEGKECMYKLSQNNGEIVIIISDICARNLDDTYQITITKKNDASKSLKLNYSAKNYWSKAIRQNNDKLSNLCKAMYLYNKEAKAYFN